MKNKKEKSTSRKKKKKVGKFADFDRFDKLT